MKKVSAPHLLLAIAVLFAAASFGWFGLMAPRAGAARLGQPPKSSGQVAYQAIAQDAPAVRTETWTPPVAQRSGADWIYEVFTPPEIFYDERTQQFSITAPQLEPAEEFADKSAPFGVELVAVKRPLFRLQLVGFVGEEGHYRGLFDNTVTSETLLAKAGRRLPDLGLRIEQLSVARVPVTLPDSMTIRQLIATAVVVDELTGEQVTLNSRERLAAGPPVATLKLEDDAEPREVQAGAQIEAGEHTYRVDLISLEPATVTITRHAADRPDEQRILTPAGSPPATL